MFSDLTQLPVNWVDGMKITRSHFQQTENYVNEQLRETTAQQLTDFNFGILPADRALELTVFCDLNQQVNVELSSCRAITPNGSRVQVTAADGIRLNASFPELAAKYALQTATSQNLYISLTVDPFQRLPFGEPLVNEDPPRHPYTRPGIRLDLLPAAQINTAQLGSSLVIGKITWQNGELLFIKDFIPSCATVGSLPSLAAWYVKFRQMLENWEQHCIRIVQKINSKVQSQQPNALSNNIFKLTEKTLDHLIGQKAVLQWILPKTAPIHLCATLIGNIQYVHTILKCFPEKEREEMINYFAEWTDVQAGLFDSQALRAFQLQYNHYDIAQALTEIEQIIDTYVQVFFKLSQLEFIGKRKGQNVFVVEQELPNNNNNSRWSPLV